MAATPASATISGFDATDTVQLGASTFASFNALPAHASQKGADTVLTLAGVKLSSLKQGTSSSCEPSLIRPFGAPSPARGRRANRGPSASHQHPRVGWVTDVTVLTC